MGIKIQIIAVLLGLSFFTFVARYIKQKSFNPGFSILWIGVSLFLISIPFGEQFYKWFAVNVLGIDDARHIIYIALIGFLLIYNFNISSKISKMNDQIQILISHNAYLETEIEKTRKGGECDGWEKIWKL